MVRGFTTRYFYKRTISSENISESLIIFELTTLYIIFLFLGLFSYVCIYVGVYCTFSDNFIDVGQYVRERMILKSKVYVVMSLNPV